MHNNPPIERLERKDDPPASGTVSGVLELPGTVATEVESDWEFPEPLPDEPLPEEPEPLSGELSPVPPV